MTPNPIHPVSTTRRGKPWLASRRFWGGFAIGSAITIAALALAAFAVVAAMPPELAYRGVTSHPERTPGTAPAFHSVALAPYVDGWKDGLPFPAPRLNGRPERTPLPPPLAEHRELPHNTAPEPGSLALLIVGAIVAGIATHWRKQ